MNNYTKAHTPWIFWPIRAVFDFIEWTLRISGRFIAAILGLAIMIVGIVFTITIIAAPLGLPMLMFGFVLMLRGIF